MKTLVIYDDAGSIFYMQPEPFTTPKGGLRFLIIDVPAGLSLKGIDTTGTEDKPIYYEKVTGDVIAATLDKVNDFQKQLDELKNMKSDEDTGSRSDAPGTDTLWGRLKMVEFAVDIDTSNMKN